MEMYYHHPHVGKNLHLKLHLGYIVRINQPQVDQPINLALICLYILIEYIFVSIWIHLSWPSLFFFYILFNYIFHAYKDENGKSHTVMIGIHYQTLLTE